MTDLEQLAVAATATIAVELAKGAGKALMDWVKRRCSSQTAAAAGAVAANPDAGGRKKVLEGSLQMDLERTPSLAGELRDILKQRGTFAYAPQTAVASGGSTITQIQGNQNRAGSRS